MGEINMPWMSLLATPISTIPLFAMMQSQSQIGVQKEVNLCNPKRGLPFHEQNETSMLMADTSALNFYNGRTNYGTMDKGVSIS